MITADNDKAAQTCKAMKMPGALIREEIEKKGLISFARFMELALYCPETGYYEKKRDNVGREGDFITSVSVGPLFGELLAFQFAEWLREMGPEGGQWSLVEAGGHDGRLAADILAWLRQNRPEQYPGIEYVLAEPSARRREWQRETLGPLAERVRWIPGVEAAGPVRGVIFSNELLDAFPVRRFGWDARRRKWFEWGVAGDGDGFQWRRMEPATGESFCPPELAAVLPDGYVIETGAAAAEWWWAAAGKLERGRLLAIDYGHASAERFSPGRTQGTLRAYRAQRVMADVLANPGEQDLTAHVDFGAVQEAGERAGLRTEQFGAQPQFLTRILQRAAGDPSFGRMDAKRARQFQTLTHPDHLGRAFRVLVQARESDGRGKHYRLVT